MTKRNHKTTLQPINLLADVDRVAARQVRILSYQAQEAALKVRLEEENDLVEHPKAGMLWSKAWEMGHSAGLSEVELYYNDLAELLK